MKQDMIVILDLGSTVNTEVARKIREMGVYSEIHPHDISLEERKKLELEETIERRREEHRELEEQTESSKIPQTDTLEVSEEGKKLSESLNCSRPEIPQEKPEPPQNPLLYHQTGTVSPAEPAEGFIHISI